MTFVNIIKTQNEHVCVSAFSLCNFSDKAVEMETFKNVRQKYP